ncbi:trehalose-phosphatase [Dechloromonas sp. XY25]|uniref:Trehalose 6-phosphate phosphatase n=1 Tax=Dechloromonas hankyongensis TaxID=2908002 RepID=A0ABS9K6A3_9RHOO|nr:trehalose-phosphatase [Dechloromonas hankyongensis]MCG2578698.1 trehalose-phosphatase [Dechloromonas hankyongensis]
MNQQLAVPPPARREWAYFLDFDGTLLELAPTPDAIVVDAALPILLDDLRAACGGAVALVSGRALDDLERRLALPALIKAGQHGLERRDAAGQLHRHATPQLAKQAIRVALLPFIAAHPALLLEDKGLTLALHYRQAPELATEAHSLLLQLVDEADHGLMVQQGKSVLEVRPAGIDKGTTLVDYLDEPPFRGRRPVFVGDDRSDEHAFQLVNDRGGISVGVGAGTLNARYRLPGVRAVRAWLAGLTSRRA